MVKNSISVSIKTKTIDLSAQFLQTTIFKRFMSYNIIPVVLTIALFAIVKAQNNSAESSPTTQPAPTELNISHTYTFDLASNQPTTWTITLPEAIPDNSDLFISIQSPPNEPLQQPLLTIKTKDDPIQQCDTANSEFLGVCRLDNSHLKPKLTLFLTAKCLVNCHLDLSADLYPRLLLDLNKTLTVKAPLNSAREYQFQMQIPLSKQFTELAIFAQISDFSVAGGGLQLFANIGDKDRTMPTSSDYDVIGESIFWGGLGLYFSKLDFTVQKCWVKIYLSIAAGMEIKLYSKLTNGNNFMISLDQAYFDYTTKQQPKIYYLDLKKDSQKIRDKSIALAFVVFAGAPLIQVSFDSMFSSVLKGQETFGTIAFLIPQSLRNASHFNSTIYISVTSSWNADYYFYTTVQEENHMTIGYDISYYNQLEQSQIFNYFVNQLFFLNTSDPNLTTTRSFALKIDMLRGAGLFGIRRCRVVEKGGNESACVLNNITDLAIQAIRKDFQDISVTIKQTSNFYQLLFQYDLSTCEPIKSDDPVMKYFYCSFHILGANQQIDQMDYTLMMTKRSYSSKLREGNIQRDAIFQGQFLYYRFSLSSLDDIEEVTFFITLMEGDVYMLGSTTDPFPSFDSKEKPKSSGSNRIVFDKSELGNNFYLSVYGEQFSEYTLGVVVNRKSNTQQNSSLPGNATNTTSHKSKIKLQLGLNQQYYLKENDRSATFVISAFENAKITLEVVELVGTVTMKVQTTDGKEMKCLEKPVTSTSIACDLEMSRGDNAEVIISGAEGAQQHFVIVYYKKQKCAPYSLNLPLYKQLPASTSGCVSFSISKLTDLQLSTSISIAQLLQEELKLSLCINGNCIKQFASRHFTVLKDMLSTLCNLNGGRKQSCPITFNFTNNSTSTLYFYLILEEKNLDIALFDGISEKVTASDLSATKSKQFYFEVTASSSTIRIFFTSFTSDYYCVLAHFVSQEDFIANSSNVYLDYKDDKDVKSNASNYYKFTKYGSGANLFAIFSEEIKKNCENCVLTLAVYSIYKSSHSFSAFQIEVSQQETVLGIGSSKIGYLEEDDIYVYQMEQPTKSEALIAVRDLRKQSSTQRNCFQLSIQGVSYFGDEDVVIIKKQSKDLNLFITGIDQICQFEVSYTYATNPITSVVMNQPYSFAVQAGATNFFVYLHNYNASFRVVDILSSGSAKISITPIDQKQSFKNLLKKDVSAYPIAGDQSQGQMFVHTGSAAFCSECTYLIAVSSSKGAEGQLFLCSEKTRIPLSVKGALKEKIDVSPISYRNYTFSSIVAFNITINIIYGRIRVTIISPNNETVIDQTVIASTILQVKPSKSSKDSDIYEYDSIFTAYSINVQAESNSSFTIRASKLAITKRIFEGVISYVIIKSNETAVLEFLNLQTQSTGNQKVSTINVLVELNSQILLGSKPPLISVAASVVAEGSGSAQPLKISRTDSQQSFNVELPLLKGDYFLNLTSDQNISISVLLVKESLIHLKPESNLLMTKSGTFELYSPMKSVMMQIFVCSGEVSVEATDTYKDFTSNQKSSSQIALEQSNYGGHFVVGSEYVFGEYFVRVNNKLPQSEVTYLLNYYYYDKKDVLPYKLIALRSPEISYSLSVDSITFSIQPIFVKNLEGTPISRYQTSYRFYFSNNKNSISKFASCRLDQVITKFPSKVSSDQVTFTLSSVELKELKDIFFVGAEAIVSLELKEHQSEHYPTQLNLIFETAQISNPRSPPSESQSNYSAKTIIVWMLLPFAIAGLALYLALRFCIKKYRGMVPDNLVEEVAESGEVVNAEGHPKNANASGTFKQDDY